MKIEITLESTNREAAMAAMEERGMPIPTPFFGPVFKNAVDHYTDRDGITITVESGELYMYPFHTISRIKYTP